MTDAMSSQGVSLRRGDGASPEAFVHIPEINSITGPSGSTVIIDATSLDSTHTQKLAGVIDEGQVSIEGNYLEGDTIQLGLQSDRAAKTVRNFRLLTDTGSPNKGISFSAIVTTFSLGFGVNQQRTFSATLEVTGAVSVI